MNNISISQKRLKEYDIAKGIAIYLVVLGHILGETLFIGEKLQIIISFCHMPVFFFISGFFLNKSIKKYTKKELFFQKIKQLLVPYLIWSGISLGANVLLAVRNNVELKEECAEAVNIFIYARSVWFLIVLFITQSIVIFLVALAEKIHVNKCIVMLIGWIIISICIPSQILSLYKFKWLFPFLILGVWLENYSEVVQKICRNGYFAIIFIILCLYTYNDFFGERYFEFKYDTLESVLVGGWYYVLSIMAIITVLWISVKMNNLRCGKILAIMGEYSMEVYVMHMFFVKFMVSVPNGLYNNESVIAYIYAFIYAGIAVGVIVGISKFFLKKFAVFQFIMGKKYKK